MWQTNNTLKKHMHTNCAKKYTVQLIMAQLPKKGEKYGSINEGNKNELVPKTNLKCACICFTGDKQEAEREQLEKSSSDTYSGHMPACWGGLAAYWG